MDFLVDTADAQRAIDCAAMKELSARSADIRIQ
jgi:hypothetical protein